MTRLSRFFASLLVATTAACAGTDSTGPAGGGGLASASGTASLILDDEVFAFIPLPGVSVTVTAPEGRSSDVLIATDGGIQVASLSTDAACATDVALFVDDAQVGPGRRVLVSNTASVLFNVGTFGFSTVATLAPGSHTITVRAKPFLPLAAVRCYVSSGDAGSELPGRPHLQAVLNVVSLP